MNPDGTQSEADELWLQDALVRYARKRDSLLRDEIAAHTSWIAVRSARRFWDRGEPFDDLTQVAHIGLLKAIERFDPTVGVHFGAYATPTILGELRRHFRDYTWSVHVPRRAKDLRSAVNVARDELSRDLGRSPRVEEIADRLKVSTESVIEALDANNAYRAHTLDPASTGLSSSMETDFEDIFNRDAISALLDRLPARERRILYLRYFEELSQAQIAEQMGTSQVHVGRLIASSLATLRQYPPDDAAERD